MDHKPGTQSLGRRQCTGTAKNGERCRRPPHRGGTCCILHGGGSPLAKMAAQRMLMSMVEPAAAILMLAVTRCEHEWITPENEDGSPNTKGKFLMCMVHEADGCPEWSVRVAAAKSLLSRAGFGEQAKMTISTDHDNLESLDNVSLANELEKLSHDLRANARNTIDVTPEIHLRDEDGHEFSIDSEGITIQG